MVTATRPAEDVAADDARYIGGLAMLAPAVGLGWVGHLLGGLPMLVTMGVLGAIVGLSRGRHLTRLLQAEAGLIALLAAASMLV